MKYFLLLALLASCPTLAVATGQPVDIQDDRDEMPMDWWIKNKVPGTTSCSQQSEYGDPRSCWTHHAQIWNCLENGTPQRFLVTGYMGSDGGEHTCSATFFAEQIYRLQATN